MISVIMLTLNSEEYIGRAIESLVNQNYETLEVVIVDGGSNDDTQKICKSFCAKIKIIFIEALDLNLGESRNLGISKASGKYICFCDSDDFFNEGRLAYQLKIMQEFGWVVSCTEVMHVAESDKSVKYAGNVYSDSIFTLNQAILRQGLNISGLMIERRLCEERFPESWRGRYGEDWQFLLELLLQVREIPLLKAIGSYIAVRDDSHTNDSIYHLMKLAILEFQIFNTSRFLKNGVPYYLLIFARLKLSLLYVFACRISEKRPNVGSLDLITSNLVRCAWVVSFLSPRELILWSRRLKREVNMSRHPPNE